jgi:putative PIN family toxin of toxin-antitoxin system
MKVVLDTNIYISSFFWKGKPYKIMLKALDKDFENFISSHIIKEINNVLQRDFEVSDKKRQKMISIIIKNFQMVEPKEKIKIIKDDPDDDKIIECAVESKSDFIVTQDKHLLKIKKFRNIKVLNPEEFLAKAS